MGETMNLKAIRARVEKAAKSHPDYMTMKAHQVVELLDALEEAIGFGGHKADCIMVKRRFGKWGDAKVDCDCGWEAFLAKMEGE